MLRALRNATRTWVAGIFVGLLVLSFAIFGINDVFNGPAPTGVARVAGENIAPADFKAEFDRVLERAKQETGRDVTSAEAREQGIDNAVLERMVGERSLAALTRSLGIMPSETALRREITQIQAFQDPATGQFSAEAYQQILSQNRLTPTGFEAQLRTDMARGMLFTAATSGIRAPGLYARQTLAAATERRAVSIIAVPARLAGQVGAPTDAQIQALYQENIPRLTRPETRALTLAVASLSDFAGSATVDEAQVRQLYERNKAQRATPATRTFVRLGVRDAAQAEAVAARLRAGEDPAAIARALSLQAPTSFDGSTQEQVPDTAVAEAAFGAQPGAVVTATSALGVSVLKVTGATAAREPTFEELAPLIRTELRQRAAGQALTAATEAFEAAVAEGTAMAQAATAAGLRLTRVAAVTADGIGPNGQPVAELAEARELLASAFELSQGDSTDLIQMGEDTYVAATVDAITASAPVPLAEVRGQLAEEWRRRTIAATLEARANAIATDARATTLEAAATKAGLSVDRPNVPLQRGQGSQALSQAVFSAKKGDIVVGPTANGVEYAVVRVESIERDDEAAVPQRLAQAEQGVRRSLQEDIVAALETVARERADVRLNQAAARRALGDSEEEAAADAPATGAGAGAGAAGADGAAKTNDAGK
jgi:peptidyl-prolyl cis-trans isomerase D